MEIKIGNNIKNLRKRDNRTQEDVANALGITFQAVSRWESGLAYPDMELVPSIANYFGISIDELFGYNNERQKIIDALVWKIEEADKANNGDDVCIDECIRMAREGLIEFPGNEKLMLCLAKLLYNAGYARYGEHHLTDGEGYDIFDVERHKKYAEWKEAKTVFEKLVKSLPDGEMKQEAIRLLTQLYAVTGETEESMALIKTLPDVSGSYDILILNSCDGRRRAEAYGRTLSKLLGICANLMCSTVMTEKNNISNADAVKRIKNAIAILETEHTFPAKANDGLTYHELPGIYLYLSTFLWREGDHDGAFEALDKAYEAAVQHFSAEHNGNTAKGLPSYWPCWCVPDYSDVEESMKADSRWAKWVKKCEGN